MKKTNSKNKKDKAITLIALVVTIIILLILAGVIVGIATNGSGLFDKAKLATDKYNNSVDKENIELAEGNNQINDFIHSDREINSNRKVVLWEGTANTGDAYYFNFKDETNSTRYSIDDFDYLCVYGDDGTNQASLIIPTNTIVTSTSKWWTLSCHHNDSYYWLSYFYFYTKDSFVASMTNTKSVGFAKGYIKQIEGIKL